MARVRRRVVAYAPPQAVALGLGMAASVFRPRPGLTDFFDFAVCSDRRGPLTTDAGSVLVEHDVNALTRADLVLVLPGGDQQNGAAGPAVDAVRRAHDRGATVAAHCAGVFVLAAAGLLDGREATTHWQYADELAARYPAATIRPEALYIDQGTVVTGAGAAAGLDLYLHLLRRDHGSALSNAIARLLVVPPHRDGGQRQYIAAPVPGDGDGRGRQLSEVIAWARHNLQLDLSIQVLADRALMSRRSFLRHFRAATGTTPHAWLVSQRLALAEELLETTVLTVQQVADRVGYSGATVLREQFVLRRGVTPSDYRRTFSRHERAHS